MIKSVKGMPDLLPDKKTARTASEKRQHSDMLPATPLWQFLEGMLQTLMSHYGYSEIRMPLLESTDLFKRSLGDITDIVEKEMFSFNRDKQNLTLRPEGTASCARACLQHNLIHNNQAQRLWYYGAMFRAEEPQAGRYRQFFQLGVEAFNMSNVDIEVEQLAMFARLIKQLELSSLVKLEINSIGDSSAREKYKQVLVEFFQDNIGQLDQDSVRRISSNPLRILDSKVESTQQLLSKAPKIVDYLDSKSQDNFHKLQQQLDLLGIVYQINPLIMRGLDYYNGLVYEWTTSQLGAQSAICAGGRYDSLVQQLGNHTAPAVGFAIGIERLLLLIEQQQDIMPQLDAYLIAVGETANQCLMKTAEVIRDLLPNISLRVNCGAGSFKNQFKKADKSGANYAFVLGEDEINNQCIGIKNLRSGSEQINIELSKLAEFWEGERCGVI